MKTPLSRWRLLPALILIVGSPTWLDAAEPRSRRSSRPPSEIKRAFDRIGDFFSHAARDMEEWERREPLNDPFFDPTRVRPQRQPYPMPGSGLYPVHPGLEEYFLFRQSHPADGGYERRIPPPQAEARAQPRQSLTVPVPRTNPYLPYYQTLGRESAPRPTSVPPPTSYRPLTPSAAGEAPRSDVVAAPPTFTTRDATPSEATPSEVMPTEVPRLQPSAANPPTTTAPRKAPALTNLPAAKPVPGRPGLVYPPGAEEVPGNMVDVRGFAPGQKVSDPRTGKIFLVP